MIFLKAILTFLRVFMPACGILLLLAEPNFFATQNAFFKIFLGIGVLTLPVFSLLMQIRLWEDLPQNFLDLSRLFFVKLVIVFPYLLTYKTQGSIDLKAFVFALAFVEFVSLMGAFLAGVFRGIRQNTSKEDLLAYFINLPIFILPAFVWSMIFFQEYQDLFLKDNLALLAFMILTFPSLWQSAQKDSQRIFDL